MSRPFAVFWSIDIEADDPLQAAKLARKAQELGSSATVFVVYDEDGHPPELGGEDGGEVVDLDEVDADPFFPDQDLVASGLHYTDPAEFETTQDDPTEDDPDVDWSLRPDMVKPAPKGPSSTLQPAVRSVLIKLLEKVYLDCVTGLVTGYQPLIDECRQALAPLSDDDPTKHLDDEECRAALRSVIKLLWWDTDDDDVSVVNPEKEWNGDTLMELSRWAADFDVCPHPDDEGGEE